MRAGATDNDSGAVIDCFDPANATGDTERHTRNAIESFFMLIQLSVLMTTSENDFPGEQGQSWRWFVLCDPQVTNRLTPAARLYSFSFTITTSFPPSFRSENLPIRAAAGSMTVYLPGLKSATSFNSTVTCVCPSANSM